MSKQVLTPRFYVDIPSFLHATGDLRWGGYAAHGGIDLLYMNPSNPWTITSDGGELAVAVIGDSLEIPAKASLPINFCALLNHNLASNENPFHFVGKAQSIDEEQLTINPETEILNAEAVDNGGNLTLPKKTNTLWNGTSIFSFQELTHSWQQFHIYYIEEYPLDTGEHQLGSFVVGKYWDAPYTPDMNLTMSRRFDGIKKQKTIGGKTLANIYYDGPTEWTMHNRVDGTYQYPPFELDYSDSANSTDLYNQYRAKSGLGRKGLRTWELTFSFVTDDEMWMAYESSSVAPFDDGDTINTITNSTIPSDEGVNVSNFDKPIPALHDDSFNFVWNCTLGGTLPFIFQPDKTNSNPDQFAICTFRDSTLDIQQVASNVYSLSVTIDEVA